MVNQGPPVLTPLTPPHEYMQYTRTALQEVHYLLKRLLILDSYLIVFRCDYGAIVDLCHTPVGTERRK